MILPPSTWQLLLTLRDTNAARIATRAVPIFELPRFTPSAGRPAVCIGLGMPKPPRVLYNGALYHVMARGNRRREIFRDDVDRLRFLEILGEARQRYHIRWRSYSLMNTHYHA